MDIRIIFDDPREKREREQDRIQESLAETIKFFGEDEKSDGELLADLVYEDFVKCR